MLILLALLVAACVRADDECHGRHRAPPGYDPTACFRLDNYSALPSQCLAPTWSLDPPCPRCWTNTAPDYIPGQSPTTLTPKLRARMEVKLVEYLDWMRTQRPPTHSDTGTVFSGLGGRALLLLKLHEATGNRSYLEEAAPYVTAMRGKLEKQKRRDKLAGYVGFQWSHVGMSCVGALAADRTGDVAGVMRHVAEVRAAFESGAGRYDDLDSGRAGLLYASAFLDANLSPDGVPYVERRLVASVAAAIVARGEATAAAHGHRGVLVWHGPNDDGLWLGQSHGVAGVLQQLLAVPELVANSTAAALMRSTLDWVVAQQMPSGNFPTEYYAPGEDWLVQWDHGAPGVSAALLAGWRAFGDASHRAAAERALQCVWTRGLLLKGLMSCHGIGGNTWMQLYAAKLTGEAKYVYRALAFQQAVLDVPLLSDPAVMRQPQPPPDAPWAFWTGSIESAIELWTDLLARGPENASLTGWEPAL